MLSWLPVLVLLDESLPRTLMSSLPRHDVRTVQQMGWAGAKNGELLRRAAAAGFGALLTVDRSLEHQQPVATAGLGIIVLIAPTNRIQDLIPLVPNVLAALSELRPGHLVRVGA